MSKHTLEQVLEALINKEDDRASDLLHQFFVQKGKSIYEELSSFDEQLEEDEEADLEEGIGGSPAHDFEEEIIADETDLEDERLFSEADEEGEEDPMSAEEPTEPEATADLAMGDEMPAEEPAAEGDLLQKADDAIDELKAIFAEIMGTQGGDDMPADEPAMGGDMPEEPTEESFRAFGEGVMPKAVSTQPARNAGPEVVDPKQNSKSPVSSGSKISANGASAVKISDGNTSGGTVGSPKEDNAGNVNKVGNAKAPALKGVAVPKMNSDTAANKTSPVAK
jgi:hypothetical protein